jgi:hypothetical protein
MIAEDLAGSVKKLAVEGETSGLEDALFEVKNKDGQTVFAVYNEGVRVYVSNGAKAVKGGFAVGGFGTDKAESAKYLFVGKDSVRIYLDTNPLTKGTKSGFAVGGYDLTKGTVQNYLDVSEDSVRVYIDSNPSTKATKGGFAVGGYDMTKGTMTNYMDVNTDATGIINPSQNRILWYPLKNAFLTGRVKIESSANVGENSFAAGYEAKAKGMYSQAMGFQPSAMGDYSTAIGRNALANSVNSFAFGESASAGNNGAYAFGSGANASGTGSFAFGSVGRDTTSAASTGINTTAIGDYSFAFGMGSLATQTGAMTYGVSNTSSGEFSASIGLKNISEGKFSFTFGCYNNASNYQSMVIGNSSTASGIGAIAIGVLSEATGSRSTAIGSPSYKLTGNFLTEYSAHTVASGVSSIALGHGVTARSFASIALGQQNYDPPTSSQTTWVSTDPLFMIGNGTGGGSGVANTNNAVMILKSGFTGLNVNNPSYRLDVDGEITSRNSASGISFRLRNDNYSTLIYHDDIDFYLLLTNSADPDGIWNNYRPFKINYSTGNVSLGCNDSGGTYSLTARSDGDIYMPRIISSTSGSGAGVTFLTINGSGKLIKYTISSSARYKNHIADIENIDWLYNLRPVNFSYKNDLSGHKEYGLIAEDVEKINPALVAYGEKGEIESVSYLSIISPLIKAVQDQKSLIEELENRNQELETKNDELTERIEKIEHLMKKKF